MGAAQAQMAQAAAGNPSRHKLSAGAGYCGGKTAFAAGYSQIVEHKNGQIGSWSIGVSVSDKDTSVGVGYSHGW